MSAALEPGLTLFTVLARLRSQVATRPVLMLGIAGLVVVAGVAGAAMRILADAGVDPLRSSCPSGALSAPVKPWLAVGGVSTPVAYCGKVIAVAGDLVPRSGAFAKISAATGVAVADFPQIVDLEYDGGVLAAVPDGRGGWFVGGAFRVVDGEECPNLAHITSEGVLDTRWCPRPNGRVHALALDRGTLYVGGRFTELAGRRRARLAALDVATGRPNGFDLAVGGPPVYDRQEPIPREVNSLALVGRTLYIGGFFSRFGPAQRENLAALDVTTGSVLSWAPRVGDARDFAPFVETLLADGSTIYFAGWFTSVDGVRRHRAAAVTTQGGVTSWAPAPRLAAERGSINAIVRLDAQALVVSGNFTTLDGHARKGIAIVDKSAGATTAWRPPPELTARRALGAHRGRLYVEGSTATPSVEGSESELVAVDVRRSRVVWTKAVGVGDGVEDALFAQPIGDFVFVGGEFDHVSGRARRGDEDSIVTIDLRSQTVTNWRVRFESESGASSPNVLLVSGDTLFAGGSFTSVNGRSRPGLAAFDLRTHILLPWRAPPLNYYNYGITALAADASRLYVGGDFLSVGGVSRTGVAALDRRTGTVVEDWRGAVTDSRDGDSPFGPLVHALAVTEERLYVGGEFKFAAGTPRSGVAAFDRESGALINWAPRGVPVDVYTLIAREDSVYVGGWCILCEPPNDVSFVEVDVTGGALPLRKEVTGESASVDDVAIDAGSAFLVGRFERLGGAPRKGVAQIDLATGSLRPWRPVHRLTLAQGGEHVIMVGSTLVVTGAYGGELAVYPAALRAKFPSRAKP